MSMPVKIHTKPKLCVRVWREELEAYKEAARLQEQTLDEWARRILWAALPPRVQLETHKRMAIGWERDAQR